MKDHRALFLRWESDFDQSEEGDWWHIIKDSDTSMDALSGNTRSKTRRGLKVFKCEPLTRDTVLAEGYEVYTSAFARYDTHEQKISCKEFNEAVRSLPQQSEFWGVREKISGRLVAFSENYVEDDFCFYNTIWFDPNSLKKYSSYALFYEMNRHYLEYRSFSYVSDGAKSLSHATHIHDFLVAKFGFRKAMARLHVVYSPWIGCAVAITYPFRKWIEKIPLKSFKKVSILLRQEEVRRQCLAEVG